MGTHAPPQAGEVVHGLLCHLDQVVALLRQRQRVTYRALKRHFQLDDAVLEDLAVELIKGQRLAADEDGDVLVWIGDAACTSCSRRGTSAHTDTPCVYPTLPCGENPHLPRPWKANASWSRCSLPISKTRRNSSGASIPKPPNSSSIRLST